MMLELKLFGAGQAHYSDQPLTGFPNRQCYLLLCYLLLNRPYPQTRERLAALFWREYPTHTSRKYLRNALWRLRQALQSVGAHVGDYLLIADDSISFQSASSYWLDIDVFETTIARDRGLLGQELTPEQAVHIEEAVDLYTGDLLEGIYADWCLYERERLFLLHLSALSRLMVFHQTHGTHERGLAYGERLLARDSTREKVHRQMMVLYWLLGDRAAAHAQYKRCCQILKEELHLPPMEQTRQLYEQIVHNQFDPTSWQTRHGRSPPGMVQSDEAMPRLVEHALQRLHRLQAMVEQTSDELHNIERLISKALLGSSTSE
jgi:DNA-binding SARP family transcriptional activator